MQAGLKPRRRVRLEGIVFILLFAVFIGLLAWLSTRFTVEADWTAGNRNTLAAASRKLLDRLSGPVEITAYVSADASLRGKIEDLLGRYQRYRPGLKVKWVNPETHPAATRAAGITSDGELVVAYEGRRQKVESPPSEEHITNALQRVARVGDKWVVFLEGHGERKPLGEANFDLGDWGRQLRSKGLKIKSINLAEQPVIPDNTAVVVIAGPQIKYLPGEVSLLRKYVKHGGNLLWLADPGSLYGLEPLAKDLGVTFQPGTVVDTTGQLVGINNPSIVVVANYGNSPITRDFNLVTVFPQARPLRVDTADGWKSSDLLLTAARSWSETGKLQGAVSYDKGSDIMGPLTIGVALSRQSPDTGEKPQRAGDKSPAADHSGGNQRVVVIGDGDFLSNSYLGNGGNLDLGMNIVNWLTSADVFIDIPPKVAPDLTLNMSQTQSVSLAFVFLVLLPGLMLGSGVWIWWRRRRA